MFLDKLATRIVELDRGQLYDWACDYPTFLKRRDEVLARRGPAASALRQEAGPGRSRGSARGSRPGAPATRAASARSRRCARHAGKRRERQGTARIQAQEAERSGTLVIEAKGVSFGYGDRPVIRDLTTTIMRGDKVGIIGPNGVGQDDPAPPLARRAAAADGTIRHGTRLEIAYFDQLKATLDEEKTVQQNVSEYDTIPINGQPRHVIGYLQDFLFAPERSRSLVKFLSGGERSRLLLAKLFTKPSNVLVLDEPTNDLDVETLELLGVAAGRVPGDGAPGQPRPGVPERRGDQHAGDRGRRTGQGVRRRLRRLPAPAARAAVRRKRRQRPPRTPAPAAPAREKRQEAELQGAAASWNRCPRGSRRSRPRSDSCTRRWPTPRFYKRDGAAIAADQRPAGGARGGAGDVFMNGGRLWRESRIESGK